MFSSCDSHMVETDRRFRGARRFRLNFGRSYHLRNVGRFLPNYTALRRRRQPFHTPPDPKISPESTVVNFEMFLVARINGAGDFFLSVGTPGPEVGPVNERAIDDAVGEPVFVHWLHR